MLRAIPVSLVCYLSTRQRYFSPSFIWSCCNLFFRITRTDFLAREAVKHCRIKEGKRIDSSTYINKRMAAFRVPLCRLNVKSVQEKKRRNWSVASRLYEHVRGAPRKPVCDWLSCVPRGDVARVGIGQHGRAPRAKAASFVLVFTPRCKVGSRALRCP